MPIREEKELQIETALRQRFFPHVAEVRSVERASWSVENHDTDRLSRCLAAYALVQHCAIDDETALRAITDGSDDGGIDALYFDRTGKRLVFVQSKFKRGGAAPAQNEVQKTITGVRAIQAEKIHQFNQQIQSLRGDIEDALATPLIKFCLLFAYLGVDFHLHARKDLDNFCEESSGLIEWYPFGADEIFRGLVEEESPGSVNETIALENWAKVETSPTAIYGQMRAVDLARLVERHGTALFEQNIRHYLGSIGVNSAIEETVRSHPEKLFYLNNGITAVARTIAHAAGTHARRVFGVERFSIVNGAQTAGAIANALIRGDISPAARIMITVVEIGDDTSGLGLEITRARNHQNAVRGSDFAGLDKNQERLRREFAVVGITYHYRSSSEARVPRDDAFTLEEAAVALACMKFPVRSATEIAQRPHLPHAIDFVVIAKGSVGRLWDPARDHYKMLFSSDLSGVRMYRIVQIYRFIDRILADTELSEVRSERKSFFKHARYFVMAFIAQRSAQIIAQPSLGLSEEEQIILSRQTNEISLKVYSALERLQFGKEPWAIFRTLTDAQQLADYILRESARVEQGQITA